jgi:ubiquinone/menaquinone biosynthesis C-methylase UbiE
MVNYDPLYAEDDSNYNPILDLVFAFQKSRLLITAGEFKIFSTIGKEKKTAEEISIITKTKADPIERLLNALVSINLLHKEEEYYTNTKVGLRYLVNSSGNYIGSDSYANYLWDSWSNLTETIATGKNTGNASWDEDKVDAYLEFSELTSSSLAPNVIKLLGLDNHNSVLDLGSGAGYYSVEMLKENPHLRIMLLDYPQVIPLTKKYMSKHIDIERFKFIEADFMTNDIGNGYDMVFLGNIINFFPFWDNVKLFQKIYKALAPGGKIVVFERILNDDRVSPVQSVISNLNALLNTQGGACYTDTEVWIMLKESYFGNISNIEVQPGYKLYFGYK